MPTWTDARPSVEQLRIAVKLTRLALPRGPAVKEAAVRVLRDEIRARVPSLGPEESIEIYDRLIDLESDHAGDYR